MRRTRRKFADVDIDRRWLFGMIAILVLGAVTVNCTLGDEDGTLHGATADSPNYDQSQKEPMPLSDSAFLLSDQLWADVTDTISTPRPAHASPTNISLEVVDANLLDILSLLAHKLDVNIIFIGEPVKVTLKIENLTPITTFQLILQKENLDYLVVGNNYIVAERGRLYEDFANRMLLSRYSLFYVSAGAMEGYISELEVPVEIFTTEANQKAIWMQGTPMALGKARELINALDIMENTEFDGARAVGGSRNIRVLVAYATGPRAEEELEALIDLLSILLDGFRDDRTDMGWVTWDHPDPIPYIFMDWENPIIKPYDLKMKITRDYADDYNDQIRYLIAEGTPENIELVDEMIKEISAIKDDETKKSPIGLPIGSEDTTEPNQTMQYIPTMPESANLPAYMVTLRAVPDDGGSLSGGGAYTQGSSVTVTASPTEGYQFVRWIENGYEMSTSNTYTFNIYADRNLEAVFIRNSSVVDQGAFNDESAAGLVSE